MASTRGIIDNAKSEAELAVNVRKATSADETAPKRKHVRSCIVYTWDHRSSQAFWQTIKVQPILSDEVMVFKALITIHKVLQEGHPATLKEAMANRPYINSLSTGYMVRGYTNLIPEYIRLIQAKLAFHHQHPEFTGTFEYEEYLSLRATNDPNEGYETITDLMLLQDKIDQFQKLIFSHLRAVGNNECRISALVPQVQESYGIYKFITNMLRAMYASTGDMDALAPLRERYEAQHYRLCKFYHECANLQYLSSLIHIPELTATPPGLIMTQDEAGPAPPAALPDRPQEIEREPTPAPPPATRASEEPGDITEFWRGEIDRQNQEYEEQQQALARGQQEQARLQQEQARLQQQAALQAQRDYEEQQRLLAEQQQREQDALAAQQAQWHTQGRLADLERENLQARAQYERDQLMLQQFDQKIRALEQELGQAQDHHGRQMASRDDQARALQEQVTMWRSKYDALAKLYSQLRGEHLDLLARHRTAQLLASSAKEANDRRERLEREVKTKNLELADMIRERDRALHDRDRASGAGRDEIERLQRDLRLAADKADSLEKSKGSDLSAMLARHNRETADLEQALRDKSREMDRCRDAASQADQARAETEGRLREREDELEVYKAGMDQSLLELSELRLAQAEEADGAATAGQLDALVDASLGKITEIIDSVLQAAVTRIDDALYELDSAMQAGNQNATPAYALSQIEKASAAATEFATAFNGFIVDGASSSHGDLIKATTDFAAAIDDVCGNTKGVARLAADDRKSDGLVTCARQSATASLKLLRGLQSFRLAGTVDQMQKIDVVINGNNEVQVNLQRLTRLVEVLAPGTGRLATTARGDDIGDMVDRELSRAADAIAAAVARLAKLKSKPRDGYTSSELHVHDSILDAATAIATAIQQLIAAATATQTEIVALGRGSTSRAAFYKKNNRWTEGLISAAKAVAGSTSTLIETADGVLSGRHSPEQLIVASNNVAASTAQLVAASRVKAGFMSRSQEKLEQASKAVGAACRALVRQVQDMIRDRGSAEEAVDYSNMGSHEFKVKEMEQQVEILQLENSLTAARQRLGEMRKISYQEE